MNNPQQLLTRKMLRSLLNVSISSLKRYEQTGQLTRCEIGLRLIRYSPDDVAAFLARKNKSETKSTPTVPEQDTPKDPNCKRKMTAKQRSVP